MTTAPTYYLFSAIGTDRDDNTAATIDATIDHGSTAAAPRFRVRPQPGVVNGSDVFIIVAVDGERTSRISSHPMSSARHATATADLLNRADQLQPRPTAASDAADQLASEESRALLLAQIESELPPQTRPVAPPAAPLTWRPGVDPARTAAADGVNTYIVERHSSTSWELCAWNSTTFDDVQRLAGTMTPTRELARAVAAEYSALGEQHRAAGHGGTSRATAAILAAYHHERARHAAPARLSAA